MGQNKEKELEELKKSKMMLLAKFLKLRELTESQAEDEGLWFVAQTAPEAYLQQELRKLHAAVEEC